MLETDPSEIINELISAVRKGGKISVVGVYSGYANHYNIGAFMVRQPCKAVLTSQGLGYPDYCFKTLMHAILQCRYLSRRMSSGHMCTCLHSSGVHAVSAGASQSGQQPLLSCMAAC